MFKYGVTIYYKTGTDEIVYVNYGGTSQIHYDVIQQDFDTVLKDVDKSTLTIIQLQYGEYERKLEELEVNDFKLSNGQVVYYYNPEKEPRKTEFEIMNEKLSIVLDSNKQLTLDIDKLETDKDLLEQENKKLSKQIQATKIDLSEAIAQVIELILTKK